MRNNFFDHLVLLIGTNPLPNLVVADYMLQNNPKIEKIWLVHSEKNNYQAGTKKEAERLEALLKERWKNHPNLKFPLETIHLSDVSNSDSIQTDINQQMIREFKNNKSIHLNYTGGTKSMSTHVYWVLKENVKSQKQFSYLDARTFRLISDESGVLESDLRKKVTLSFDEMIRLHGFERKNEPKDFLFSDALKIFQKCMKNNQLNEFSNECGYNRELFLDSKGKLVEKLSKLSEQCLKHLKEFRPNQLMMAVINKMPEEYRLFDMNARFNENLPNKKFKTAVKFFDGEWLEYHCANVLQDHLTNDKIRTEQNWVIKKPDWTGDLDFELDVVLINGYQLTGISCTTDTGKYCKSKGFEIIHRTRQIGGDESKAVLLTRMKDKTRDLVQKELEYETGGNQGNILVLGEKHLTKEILARKIKQFVLYE